MKNKLKAIGATGHLLSHFDVTYDLKKADVGILPGGSDWYPKLYTDHCHSASYYDINTDIKELQMLKAMFENGLTILGICRGAQGLCIVSGGELFQDVNNHQGEHLVTVINPHVKNQELKLRTNSCHHQMLDLTNLLEAYEYKLLAYSQESSKILGLSSLEVSYLHEPELVSFPLIKALGIQGHPEWADMPHMYRNIAMEYLKEIHETTTDASVMNMVIQGIDEKLKILEDAKSGKKKIHQMYPFDVEDNYYEKQPKKHKKTGDYFTFEIFE